MKTIEIIKPQDFINKVKVDELTIKINNELSYYLNIHKDTSFSSLGFSFTIKNSDTEGEKIMNSIIIKRL